MSGFTRSQSCCAWCIVAAGLIPVLAASGTVHSQGQEAAVGTVDDARLLAAGDQDDRNWITFGQDYSNQRFSALTQINRNNVRGLVPAWIFQTGVVGSFQTTPLVIDGVMYITTPGNDVAAVDAATGARIWHYRHAMRSQPFGALSNRGAGIGYGKVYEASDDGRLSPSIRPPAKSCGTSSSPSRRRGRPRSWRCSGHNSPTCWCRAPAG